MKKFEMMEIIEAKAHALSGFQALHLHNIIVDPDRAPACFVREVEAGRQIAHLFDLDKERLIQTAKSFGVRVIYIDCEDTENQHIDLCGKPLREAIKLCDNEQGMLF